MLRCILSLGVALSLIDATLPRLLAYVLDVVRVQCSVTCRGFGWFPGSQVQHEGDRCSKAIRDSSRTQWLTLSGAQRRRLSSSFGLVTVLVDP